MKHIYRLLASALVLFTAAACYNEEIESPLDPDQQQSDFRITASIVKTRVSYQDDTFGGYLELEWEDGDVLFGYIEGEPKKQIELKVDGDPDTDGVATLVAASGSEDALSSLIEGDIVDLVYTGQSASYDQGGSSITVDMTRQSDHRKIPACMHSRGVVTEDNGSKCLEFHFVSDCAIFEVESLTGMAVGTLSTISITNLFPEGKYTLSDEGFTFAGNGTISTYTYTCGEPWGVETGGVVTYDGNPHPLLIAVAPNPEANAITVGAKVFNGGEPMTISYNYGAKSIAGGTCYVVSAQPYVAMTVDGQCFRTVKAAFDHAYSIRDDYPDDNTVTLIKKEIYGLGTTDSGWWKNGNEYAVETIIDIDYDVTLDLNGCTLDLQYAEDEEEDIIQGDSDTSGAFNVKSGGSFTVTDSSDGDGILQSCSDCELIINGGTTIVEGGSLWSFFAGGINNKSSLSVSGGEIFSYEGPAINNNSNCTVVINDGMVDSIEGNAIRNYGSLKINDGEVFSEDGIAIESQDGNVIINAGTIFSITSHAIKSFNASSEKISFTIVENDKDLDACNPIIYNATDGYASIYVEDYGSGTDFNMRNGLVYSPCGAIDFRNNVSGTISGGQIEGKAFCALSIGNGSNISISGGKFITTSSNHPTIRVFSTQLDHKTFITVERPEGTDKLEPLLYSSSKACLVADKYNISSNYSEVKILGGFLFSENNSEFYYENHSNTEILLDMNNFGDFYSNRVQLYYSNSTHYLYKNSESYSILVEPINGNVAIPLGEENSINVELTFHNVNESDYSLEPTTPATPATSITFDYQITNPNIEDSPLSGTQSYHFSDFNW